MATLCALRKIGGFSDLEGRARSCAIATKHSSSGTADIIGMKTDFVSRGHPSLLLDIIETMFLAKNDPSSTILKERIGNPKSLCEMVISCAPMRDVCKEFDSAMISATHSIALVARMITGLNYVLARCGKLRAARAYIEPHGDTARPCGSIHGSRNAKNAHVPQPIVDIIESRCARMSELRAKTDLLLASASMIDTNWRDDTQYRAENEDSRGAADEQELCVLTDDKIADIICAGISSGILDVSSCSEINEGVDSTALSPNGIAERSSDVIAPRSSAIDKYIAQSILAARVVQNIEEYVSALTDDIKKIIMSLDIVIAQCAVSMSNLAVIA